MFPKKRKEVAEKVESSLMLSVTASYLSGVYLPSRFSPGVGNPIN